jgi:hypothetical protein
MYDTKDMIQGKKRQNKPEFFHVSNFHSAKDIVKRIKRQTTDREKIFAKAYLIEDCHPHYKKNP